MPKSNKAEVLSRVCAALEQGSHELAAAIARSECPWAPKLIAKRSYSKALALRVFERDGFIDRYFGSPLVFPGALLLLGHVMSSQFPAHPTWRVAESHEIYWELWPAVDHLIPLSRGGGNDEKNLVSTSTLHNNAKGHWLLEELGWSLHGPGDIRVWDGLTSWFVRYVESQPDVLASRQLKGWHRALATKQPNPDALALGLGVQSV
jgi:5-methylcytosine-specific restriction endonuclease McrA